MSHNNSTWLQTWLSCYFMRQHGTTCVQPTDKTRNSVDALLVEMCKKTGKKEISTRSSSIRHVSSAFGPASGSWTASLEQVKRWLHTAVEAGLSQNIMFVWSAFSLGNGNLMFGTTHFDLPRSGPQWFLLFGPWMKQVPVHRWIWSQEAPLYSWGSSHLYQEQETQI